MQIFGWHIIFLGSAELVSVIHSLYQVTLLGKLAGLSSNNAFFPLFSDAPTKNTTIVKNQISEEEKAMLQVI